MTNKEKVLQTCRELQAKYEKANTKAKYLNQRSCSLCSICNYYCRDCIFYDNVMLKKRVNWNYCMEFKSVKRIFETMSVYERHLHNKKYSKIVRENFRDALKARGKAYKKIIRLLEKCPTSQFTKKGRKPFNIPFTW